MEAVQSRGRLASWGIGAARAVVLPALLALSACGGPPPLPPTVVQLKIAASADVNKTSAGQGAPVVIRVYQLSSTSAFEKAEFFRLLNGDTATLGADLLKRDEYLLPPGGAKEATLTLNDQVHAIGVFAAFREFQKMTWRGTVTPPPHKTTTIDVLASATGVAAAPAP